MESYSAAFVNTLSSFEAELPSDFFVHESAIGKFLLELIAGFGGDLPTIFETKSSLTYSIDFSIILFRKTSNGMQSIRLNTITARNLFHSIADCFVGVMFGKYKKLKNGKDSEWKMKENYKSWTESEIENAG